jgi:hypothetical protein
VAPTDFFDRMPRLWLYRRLSHCLSLCSLHREFRFSAFLCPFALGDRWIGADLASCIPQASVQKHQRSANHHRFVFHHDQVTFSERRCCEGEAGVVQTAPIRSYSPSPSSRGSSPSPSTSPNAHGSYSDFKDGPAPLSNLRVPSQRGADGRRSPSPTPPSRREGLTDGDVVYWHNLVAGGERAEPIDPKARSYAIPQRAGR